MKLISLLAVAALAASAGTAFAADLPSTKAPVVAPAPVSPWDFDIGARSDLQLYLPRHHPVEPAARASRPTANCATMSTTTWQLYAGMSGESIKFSPNYLSRRFAGDGA